MPVQTESVSYLPENRFRVVIDGNQDAGTFTKAGPLYKFKADTMAIRSGTSLTEESKAPGNVTFEPLVLEQGMSKNRVLKAMADEVVNVGGITGTNGPAFKHSIRVEQLDRDGTTVLCSYTYHEAWVAEYDEGNFDAESNKFRIRVVKIEFLAAPIYNDA